MNIERLLATNFDDIVQGGSGDETILGLGGNDTLGGGAGSDSLIGGAGVDSFVYNTTTDGADVIIDLRGGSLGDEVIILTGGDPDFDTLEEVEAVSTEVGSNVFINFGDGNTLTLVNFSLTRFDETLFNFTMTPDTLTSSDLLNVSMEFGGVDASGADSFDFEAIVQATLDVADDGFSFEDYAFVEAEALISAAAVDPADIEAYAEFWAGNGSDITEGVDLLV